MANIRRVENEIITLPHVKRVGILGDPGCEGLGTYNLKVYAGALEACAKDDITLAVGDLVPIGGDRFYREISAFTESVAGNPVYTLRGNHDTGEYEKYFGRCNYCILAESFAIVVLDNAFRKFDDEGLALLARILNRKDVSAVIVAFHIPLPNRFIKNSVSEEELARLKAAYSAHRGKVKYFICGHVHSRFEDEMDGIPLVCTGGAGARIEDVSEEIRASDVEHHVVHMTVTGGTLTHQFEYLSPDGYAAEREDAILRERLEETVKGELFAHLKYLMYAGRAHMRGYEKLARLFEALAESEFCHARNFYAAYALPSAFADCPAEFIKGEKFEYEQFYRMMEEYAAETKAPVSENAYRGAAAAERVHAKFLEKAKVVEDFDEGTVYVCPICGHVMAGEAPDRCPVCGGPKHQFKEY